VPPIGVSLENLRRFDVSPAGEFVLPQARKGRYHPVQACRDVPRCCGITVGVGRGLTGDVVIRPYCPPPRPPSEDQRSLAEAIKWAMKDALRESTVTTQPTTIVTPGFRGRRAKVTQVVGFASSGGSFSGSASCLVQSYVTSSLAGAPATPPVVVQVSSPALLPMALVTFVVPGAMGGVLENIFIGANSADAADAIQFIVTKSGQIVQPNFNMIDALTPVPMDIPVGPGDTVVLQGLLEGNNVFLLRIQMNFWLTPVQVVDDTLESRQLRNDPSRAMPEGCM
jgi:hypothetical protein